MFSSIIPEHLRWNVAFGFAAVVMLISLLTFVQTQKSLGEIGVSPLLELTNSKRKTYEYFTYIGSILVIPIIIVLEFDLKPP
jgi:POT family proton-dependent oligopeptide transporter